ncbi:MAG: hypothetical protein QNK37_21370 [Acidobacteriota bacterium]|nr:hypothetical protein [Acidobacteriota bacterium]
MRLKVMFQTDEGWPIFGSIMAQLRPEFEIEHLDPSTPLHHLGPTDALLIVETCQAAYHAYHERFNEAVEAFLPIILIQTDSDRLGFPIPRAQIVRWNEEPRPTDTIRMRLQKLRDQRWDFAMWVSETIDHACKELDLVCDYDPESRNFRIGYGNEACESMQTLLQLDVGTPKLEHLYRLHEAYQPQQHRFRQALHVGQTPVPPCRRMALGWACRGEPLRAITVEEIRDYLEK